MKRLDRFAKQRPNPARHAARAGPPPAAEELELDVAEIGARGDAVAQSPRGPIYLPYALPGERVLARVHSDRGEVAAVLAASTERVAPPCAHFGRCGGCQLQHWAQGPYLEWKREQVVRALLKRGIEIAVEPIVEAWGEGRRRAGLHAARGGKFGFIARGQAGIVPISECPVLAPALAEKLPALKRLGAAFAPPKGEIVLACLATETGVDVDIRGAGASGSFDRALLEKAAEAARAAGLARLSFDGEPLAALTTPLLTMGLAKVAPPPGAFLQPTAKGEAALSALALEAVAGAARVADLFCGIGTFALRLAAFAEVHGVDGEADMLAALKQAADGAGGRLKAVTVERRDLLRTPVAALELKKFDAVVFDPPRSGARLQAEQIGASKVSRVAAVSCDPATFARDARVLIDAGFALTRVTPVDQFRWSPHVEIVGAFQR